MMTRTWNGSVFRSIGADEGVSTDLFLSGEAVKEAVERLRTQHHRTVRASIV